MITSEKVEELYNALIKAQSTVENAKKNAENPFYRSSYADLTEVLETAKKVMIENGLAIIQSPSSAVGKVSVTTRIIHTSGQWIEDTLTFDLVKNDPQSVGSAITYGRRYAIASMLGFTQEDDDGNKSSGKDQSPHPASKAPTKPAIEVVKKSIMGATNETDITKLKERIAKYQWSEEESLDLDDAIKTQRQIIKERKEP